MGRKSGKTTLCAALALCHLVGPEAVPRGQVVSAAADRGQASILFNELKAFALADAEIADRLLFREHNKTCEDVVITGWPAGEAEAAAATIFRGWLAERGGTGSREDQHLFAALRKFIGAHGSARFETVREAT